MPSLEVMIEGRARFVWVLKTASYVPSLALFKLAARAVRFEWRIAPRGKWELIATAYELIDWDGFDDGGDDDGEGIPTLAALLGGIA